MTPRTLLETAILMGLFVAAGGVWGVLYVMGRARARKGLLWAALASYALALTLAIAIVLLTPLDTQWKMLILASALAYAVIPPVTLGYLHRLHADS